MSTQVTVTGAFGAPLIISDNSQYAYGAFVAGQISAAILAGDLSPITYTGGNPPAPVGNLSYYLIDTISGSSVTEPVGYAALLVAALGGATVRGNGSSNQSVLGGQGAMSYSDSGGSGVVVGAAPGSLIAVNNASGNGYEVFADAMSDTISAGSGLTAITLGTNLESGVSGDLVFLGAGSGLVTTGAADTIFAGAGAASIDANRALVVTGTGQTTVVGNGTDTIVAFQAGQTTVNTTGGELLTLGNATVTLNDTPLQAVSSFIPQVDTVFGGNGVLNANIAGNSLLLVGGTGTINFNAQPLGSSAQPLSTIGASTIFGFGSAVNATGGAPVFVSTGTPGGRPTYSATANSSAFYTGDADLFLGGVNGGNVITAGAGRTTIFGGGAGDVLSAAYAGNDFIVSGPGATTMLGGNSTGNDTFFGGSGPNVIHGGTGNDIIVAGSGANTVTTGAGANLVFLGGGSTSVHSTGSDTIVGGGGAATIAVDGNAIAFAESAPLTLVNGSGSATLVGGGSSVTVFGGLGSGLFAGGSAGFNLLVAGAGASTLLGVAAGDQLIATGATGDILQGGSGPETLNAAGSTGNNIIAGGSGPNLMVAGSGHDTFVAGNGNATLVAGTGGDLIVLFNARSGGQITIDDFHVGSDHLTLQGYAAGTAALAASEALTVNGNATVVLPDSTTVTFAGITKIDGSSFV